MKTKHTEKELLKIRETISNYIHKTPVHSSKTFDNIIGANCYFKCENFQKTGSFKIRGAAYALSQLSAEEKELGVITHSSGNFAQALSYAALTQDIPATVVMPENAPQSKVDAVRNYEGKIVFSESNSLSREQKVKDLQKLGQQTFIHPSDNIHVIEGHSSAVMELLEEHPEIDTVICPVGGGGLLAGTCLGASRFNSSHSSRLRSMSENENEDSSSRGAEMNISRAEMNTSRAEMNTSRTQINIKVYGAEPENANDAFLSLKKGEIIIPESTDTIADGLRTYLGKHNFPIIQELCEGILCVSEDEIREAQKFVFERMKLVIEPSSAVAVAAVKRYANLFRGKQVGIIISGGNTSFNY